ncbi:hypothetical protein AHF37_10088, partial [Paragonimus kellicotti]
DLLRFANLITESVLHELTTFVTAYTNLFAISNLDASDDSNTIIEVVSDETDNENFDVEPVTLEVRLADLVEEVLDNCFKLTEERFAVDNSNEGYHSSKMRISQEKAQALLKKFHAMDKNADGILSAEEVSYVIRQSGLTEKNAQQQACSETPLLVRAVDRFHGRVQSFTRTFSSAIYSMVAATTDDLTSDQYEMVPRPNETLSEIYGQQTRQLCERFAQRALDLVHSVAQARTEFYLSKLCQSAVDSITDLRQQLVSPSLQLGPGQIITSNPFTGQDKGADHLGQLSRLSDMLNSTLVTQLKEALKALEMDLNRDGCLDLHEVRLCVQHSGLPESAALEFMALFDLSGDNKITLQEYITALGLTPPPPTE